MRAARYIALILALALLVLAPAGASAATLSGDNGVTVTSDQTIDDDLYVASNSIVIEGTVNGDVYAAGSSVTIRGTVNGDVLAAGSDVLIGGTVSGSVRAAGSTVRLAGAQVGSSVSAFAQTFTVERDSSIAGGLNFGANTAAIRGSVGRSVMGGGSSVVLASQLDKDVQIAASSLTLEPSTNIAGGLTFYSDEGRLDQQQGAVVQGETKRVDTDKGSTQQQQNNQPFNVLATLWGVAALYVIGAVLIALFPTATNGVASAILRRPGLSVATGFLALLAVLPVFLILILSLVGIPLAIIGVFVFVLALYLAKFFAGLAIGRFIADRAGWKLNPYGDAAIGVIGLTLLEPIPVVGGIVAFVAMLFGLGAQIIYLFNRSRPAKAKAA